MATIAFILLCHKDPDAVVQQAQSLTAAGDHMASHFDGAASDKDVARIKEGLAGNPNVVFAKRVRCGWGEWSLVQATLNALDSALEAFPRATHFMMVSGDCMAIKSAEYAHDFLEADDCDYIESLDFFESNWNKTGMKEDRLIYRHYLNERKHKKLFYWMLQAQRKLGLKRAIPEDIQVQSGSQWGWLRRLTIEWIREFVADRPDVVRFFRTTWIPDETFFQTLVRHLVPEAEIRSRTLTFLMFSDYGMPVNFYNDHYDLLLSQDFLFARKISSEAHELKDRLAQLYAAQGAEFKISNEGRSLYQFLTERGRIGRRFGMRFWETETTLGRERELLIVICKKWHVAKRLLAFVQQKTNIPTIEYMFNEEDTALPDLGGIQSTLAKRTRHRRALMRLLFDYFATDRMILCIDPANIELLKDLTGDRSVTRLLEIECDMTDEYLTGHAKRIGLAGDHTSEETWERLLPTIRSDIVFESDRIRDAGFENYGRMRQSTEPRENARALADFLSISPDLVEEITSIRQLFDD
jgi:hypothetical protein